MESRGILPSVLVHFACTCLIIARMEKKNPYLGFFFFVYRGLVAGALPAVQSKELLMKQFFQIDIFFCGFLNCCNLCCNILL